MFQIELDGKMIEKTRKPVRNWRDAYYELMFLACVQSFKRATVSHYGWQRHYIIRSNGKVALERDQPEFNI